MIYNDWFFIRYESGLNTAMTLSGSRIFPRKQITMFGAISDLSINPCGVDVIGVLPDLTCSSYTWVTYASRAHTTGISRVFPRDTGHVRLSVQAMDATRNDRNAITLGHFVFVKVLNVTKTHRTCNIHLILDKQRVLITLLLL